MKSFSLRESERLLTESHNAETIYIHSVTIVTSYNTFEYFMAPHHYPLLEGVCATSINQK